MTSIKKNFIYSSILTTSNYIFPLLVYPYVSRVLGVEKIGICNFVDGIINYFVLFSMLGINILGIREIAKVKINKEQLNSTFNSLFIINLISTIFMIIILLLCIEFIPKFSDYKKLLYIGVFKLVGNVLLIEWFYKGLESFKYITTRTIIIKVLYVIAIFLFIKKENDYIIYYGLTALMIIGNSIFNCIYARNFVKLTLKDIKIKPYISPYITLGFYLLLTSMYTSFNIAYLGFLGGDIEVGYYTTATKIYTILLAIFTAFTGVMLPRMSSLISENKIDEFKGLIKKSIKILLYFSIPTIIIAEFFTPEIISIISGNGYEGAIQPMRIILPLMFIIGYEQIIIIQGLMPLKKDKAITINSILGAIGGIVFNLLLVPLFYSTGSAYVWVFSELIVLMSAQHFIHKYIGISFPFKPLVKNIIFYVPLVCILFVLTHLYGNGLACFIFSCILSTIYFFLLHFLIIRESFILNIIAQFTSTLKVLK